MTRKEAAEILPTLRPNWSSDPDDYERAKEAIQVAISALLPWKRLSEESPKEPGRYLLYRSEAQWGDHYLLCGNWTGTKFYAFGAPLDDITHWCKELGPEKET